MHGIKDRGRAEIVWKLRLLIDLRSLYVNKCGLNGRQDMWLSFLAHRHPIWLEGLLYNAEHDLLAIAVFFLFFITLNVDNRKMCMVIDLFVMWTVSSVGFAIVLRLSIIGFIKFLIWVIFIDCIAVGICVATLFWSVHKAVHCVDLYHL